MKKIGKGNTTKKLNLDKLQISKIKNIEEITGGARKYTLGGYTCLEDTIFWGEHDD